MDQLTLNEQWAQVQQVTKQRVKKERRQNKKQRFMIRYNLTQERLMYRGRPLSDAIALKAFRFLELNCIDEIGPDGDVTVYICKPILGYNKTTYTLHLDPGRKIARCNCQHCTTYHLKLKAFGFCSHLLALFLWADIDWRGYQVIGGVRE